jgi:hypothetical protein
MSDEQSKQVLSLGGFAHEGLTASVKALGYTFRSLALDRVTPRTWLKRAAYVHALHARGNLAATFIYLHSTLLLQASKSAYREAFLAIVQAARPAKVLIFVFQDNLDGNYAMRHGATGEPMTVAQIQSIIASEATHDEYDFYRVRLRSSLERLKDYEARKAEVDAFVRSLYDLGVEIAPFYQRSDVTIRLQEFLGDVEQGIFLRLFVPTDRLQAEQLGGLLNVLERYLRQIERQEFSIDTRKSAKGIVYLFRAQAELKDLENLNEAFGRFDTFMKLCGDDPSRAGQVLQAKGVRDQEAASLVERYAKDYKRLVLDARHEFERKGLALRQRLENEVVEGGALPMVTWSNQTLTGLLAAAATGQNVQINVGTMSVINAEHIQTEVDQIINGHVSYTSNDHALLDLVARYAERLEALQCRSDLDQLKDASTAEPARQNAKQRLVGFLKKVAQKTGSMAERVAVEALARYLESVLKSGG